MRIGVELLLESLDLFPCDLGEIGSLGVKQADEFVEILGAPSFSTDISMSVVDLGPEDAPKLSN